MCQVTIDLRGTSQRDERHEYWYAGSERLVLACGYEALHAAQYDRTSFKGTLTGVYLGIAVQVDSSWYS